jgi:tRNA dimethylallyltransferase
MDANEERSQKSVPHVVIAGATATGKTDLAMELARELHAEIVSADSMMVYRHMDIGTAKPGPAQRADIAHHLIDIVDPDEHFDAALFRQSAHETMQAIASRGRLALVVGGTGLYLRALERGLVKAPARNDRLRCELEALAREKGTGHLFAELIKVDPEAGKKISPADRVRIIRALEIFHGSGVPASTLREEHGFRSRAHAGLFLVLSLPRDRLRERIGQRAKAMVEQGLLAETEKLLAMGYKSDLKSMKALNYRHAIMYLEKRVGRQELLARMEKDTWHFARRQLNWFRSEPGAEFVEPNSEIILKRIEKYLGCQ